MSKLARPLDEYGKYTMGTGHVKFFYNKGLYLSRRTEELYRECRARGFNVTYKKYKEHPEGLNLDWTPTIEDVIINILRIREKVQAKPRFYRKTKYRDTREK